MKLELDNMHSLMDLARYMVKQENRIKELERENYVLSKEKLKLEQYVERLKDYDGYPAVKEVTE